MRARPAGSRRRTCARRTASRFRCTAVEGEVPRPVAGSAARRTPTGGQTSAGAADGCADGRCRPRLSRTWCPARVGWRRATHTGGTGAFRPARVGERNTRVAASVSDRRRPRAGMGPGARTRTEDGAGAGCTGNGAIASGGAAAILACGVFGAGRSGADSGRRAGHRERAAGGGTRGVRAAHQRRGGRALSGPRRPLRLAA